jgi:RimJ/RimL family protein N-acetyltransferase
VDRVTARVWADKHRNHRFAKHLGFVKEGELKFFNRPNLIIYGLYREQAIARWLTDSYLRHKGVHDGKRITVTPACA